MQGGWKYVTMAAEVLEQLNFSQSTLCENLLAENIGDFLDGDALACLSVGRSANEKHREVSKARERGA